MFTDSLFSSGECIPLGDACNVYPDYTGVFTDSLFSSGECIPLDTPILVTLTVLILYLVLLSVFRLMRPVMCTLTTREC